VSICWYIWLIVSSNARNGHEKSLKDFVQCNAYLPPPFSIPSSLPASMFCEPLPLNFRVEALSVKAWGRCLAIFLCTWHVLEVIRTGIFPSAIHLLFQTQNTTGSFFLSCLWALQLSQKYYYIRVLYTTAGETEMYISDILRFTILQVFRWYLLCSKTR
jgi:hypothetical protein